jgi:hypothetical protein
VWTTTLPRRARPPVRSTAANSPGRRMRNAGGSTRYAETSGGQFAATLTSPCGDDRPSGTGAHAQPEAVRFGTPAVVRLEGALAHGQTPSLGRSVPAARTQPTADRK